MSSEIGKNKSTKICESKWISALIFILIFASLIVYSNSLTISVYAAGSANLKDIVVEGGVLHPAITSEKNNYAIEVSKDVDKVVLKPIPEDPEAKVVIAGDSTDDLEFEKTRLALVQVTSADGSITKEYGFYITKYNRVITPSPEPTANPNATKAVVTDAIASDNTNTSEPNLNKETQDKVETSPGKTDIYYTASNSPNNVVNYMSKGDIVFVIVLAFLAGILIGYGIFYLAQRLKNKTPKW